jgi:hypothetical protein
VQLDAHLLCPPEVRQIGIDGLAGFISEFVQLDRAGLVTLDELPVTFDDLAGRSAVLVALVVVVDDHLVAAAVGSVAGDEEVAQIDAVVGLVGRDVDAGLAEEGVVEVFPDDGGIAGCSRVRGSDARSCDDEGARMPPSSRVSLPLRSGELMSGRAFSPKSSMARPPLSA